MLQLVAIDFREKSDDIVSKFLMDQMKSVGFCQIVNVPGYREEKLKRAMETFHSLPPEVKMKLAPKHYASENKNIYQGFFPLEKKDDAHKEFYQLGMDYGDVSKWERDGCALYEPVPWFAEPELQKYSWIIKEFKIHYKRMHKTAMRILRCIAMGLGKPKDYFDSWFAKESGSLFRSQYYLPRAKSDGDSTSASSTMRLTAPEHRDSGFITLLTTFMFSGLQVEYRGKYRDVQGVPDSFVVNIGALLQRISNNRIKATMHRVVDIGVERYSCPFFFDPKFSARVTTNILSSKRARCEDLNYDLDPRNKEEMEGVVTYGEFVSTRMLQYIEWQGFKMRKINFDFEKKYGLHLKKNKLKLEQIFESEK